MGEDPNAIELGVSLCQKRGIKIGVVLSPWGQKQMDLKVYENEQDKQRKRFVYKKLPRHQQEDLTDILNAVDLDSFRIT